MLLPLAAGVCTILVILIGVILYKLEKRTKAMHRLEKLLANSSSELASLEILKSNFITQIGDVLSTPLKTIEASSGKLNSVDADIPAEVRNDIKMLSDQIRSLIRILGVFEEISEADPDSDPKMDRNVNPAVRFNAISDTEIVHLDEIVSEAAMEISEDAADKLVSLSIAICGDTEVAGKKTQLFETVLSIFRESLKLANSGTVMTVDLRIEENVELETGWDCADQQAADEKDILGAGFIRLVASSHGGWLNTDIEHGHITLILPLSGEKQ